MSEISTTSRLEGLSTRYARPPETDTLTALPLNSKALSSAGADGNETSTIRKPLYPSPTNATPSLTATPIAQPGVSYEARISGIPGREISTVTKPPHPSAR